MSTGLIFTAQALDNTSTDPIQVDGVLLTATDVVERQDTVTIISEVSRHGTYVLQSDGIKFRSTGSHFLIEILSEERDDIGRAAPVVCCGELRLVNDPEMVISEIQNFVSRIERTISSEHIQAVYAELVKLKENPRSESVPKLIIWGLLFLAAILMMAVFTAS